MKILCLEVVGCFSNVPFEIVEKVPFASVPTEEDPREVVIFLPLDGNSVGETLSRC